MKILNYDKQFEQSWLRCRLLSYFYSAFYEDVLREKPGFSNRTIELIAVQDDEVIGLIDVVLDDPENKLTFLRKEHGAFIATIAVHPDHQNNGIAQALYDEAMKRLDQYEGLSFIELYTRDDEAANRFYEKQGFIQSVKYYDVFGVEKGLRKPVSVKLGEGRVLAESDGKPVGFALVDSIYEAYDEKGVDQIDHDRVVPVYGYLKEL
ncbi:GNAT family N-acetyltransferase [Jeotgalibacillus aurantiacus]|uniref:GNAT family N-acetyltransferase n=1 Tax=Jeotgalibacillus aurantiacus TaxID=2763266 RepID=UPI001D0ACFBC|nr:GNAT family N-acetyltransferase [Jeotgalibacillus aurantiacus]